MGAVCPGGREEERIKKHSHFIPESESMFKKDISDIKKERKCFGGYLKREE